MVVMLAGFALFFAFGLPLTEEKPTLSVVLEDRCTVIGLLVPRGASALEVDGRVMLIR